MPTKSNANFPFQYTPKYVSNVAGKLSYRVLRPPFVKLLYQVTLQFIPGHDAPLVNKTVSQDLSITIISYGDCIRTYGIP